MNYQDYIKAELLILVPVLYLIGMALKKSSVLDKYIPLILGGVSIVLSTIWIVSTSPISSLNDAFSALFTAITQGILTAGASVYSNQLYVQSGKDE